ncbi:MAG: hypothetical protein SH850_12020 [Planctomycetaceae bacterium]|nr:hypothetical protein [Planctomycetaceae bacterium]
MSIGIVSLATLFPISVLRSIQASQLTNAAVLRYNAETQLRTVPEILNIGTEWQPATAYQAGDSVVPPLVTRRKTPPAVFVATTNATASGTEPSWNFREGGPTDDGTNTGLWRTVRLKNYVVDPLGYVLVDPSDPVPAFRGTAVGGPTDLTQQHFGNVNGRPFSQYINRFPAFGLYLPNASAAQNEFNAAALSILPDSWTNQAESLEVTYTAGNTDILLGGVDPVELSSSVQPGSPDLVPDRIVIFDDSNRRSFTFPVTAAVTGTAPNALVSWSGIALPGNFIPVKARVESLERRYSYVLSVRRGTSGVAHIDVVVFFRRSYGVPDEQVYSCVFRKIDRGAVDSMGTPGGPGTVGVDDNQNGTVDDVNELGWATTTGDVDQARNFCIVQYDSASGQKPFYKKGSYVCDIHNLRWYRVIDVTEDVIPPFSMSNATPSGYEADPIAAGMDRFVRLTLDQPVLQDSPMDVANGNPFTPVVTTVGGVGVIGGALLMRGVVDVFPLKARVPWEE